MAIDYRFIFVTAARALHDGAELFKAVCKLGLEREADFALSFGVV